MDSDPIIITREQWRTALTALGLERPDTVIRLRVGSGTVEVERVRLGPDGRPYAGRDSLSTEVVTIPLERRADERRRLAEEEVAPAASPSVDR